MNIIAIGGGELGDNETFEIDKIIVEETNKKNPSALFIPTASGDAIGYWEIFNKIYGEKLGCKTDVLFLVNEQPPHKQIAAKINLADVIYIGGGNTQKMLNIWKEKGADNLLLNAANKDNKVVTGLSAGAMCWFKYGNSDSPMFDDSSTVKTIKLDCLNLINASFCPHISSETFRLNEFKNMMKYTEGKGIGLDDYSALHVKKDKYRILVSKMGEQENSQLHLIFYSNNQLYYKKLKPHLDFKPLYELI